MQFCFRTIRGICMAVIAVSGSMVFAADFSSQKLADNLYQVSGPSGNTLVAVADSGLVLVEGVPEALAESYLDYVRALTGETRISALVNTHWHPESAGLNAAVIRAGGEVIAHVNTKQWLGATIRRRGEEILHTPVPASALPTRTFYQTDTLAFKGGNIELGYLLQVHTDGDIYAYFPAQNVLYTGPAVRSDSWAAVDEATGGFVGALTEGLDALALMVDDNTVVVPASGPDLNRQEYVAQMDMYKFLLAEIISLLRQSRSPEEVIIANPAVGLMPGWGDPSEFLDEGFRSFYGHLRDTKHVGFMP